VAKNFILERAHFSESRAKKKAQNMLF